MSAAATTLMYLVFALGAAAIYFLLPRGSGPNRLVGVVLGVLALAAWLIVLMTKMVMPASTTGFFYLFSTIAVAAAARVITHPKPVYSAIYFVLVVVAVAALLVLLQAEFLAIALIIIYAGAILVTYLFVIMLAQQAGAPTYDWRAREPFAAVLAGFVLMAAVVGRAGDYPYELRPQVPARLASDAVQATPLPDSNTLAMGAAIMTKYVVTLEIAGVLLLVAMIGAIALSRKKVPAEGRPQPERPLGEVGREVPPY